MAIPGVPSFMIDNALGTELSVAHMVDDHGCRRIAYIGGPAGHEEAELRAGGYRSALAARSMPHDPRLFARGAFTIPTGRDAMRAILDRGVDFDAVVSANDRMALGAIEALKEEGRRIPEDVIVCGFDDAGIARFTKPSLTTVRQPVKQLGGLAVSAVLRMMDGEAAPALQLVRVELTRRESCGCGYHSGESHAPPPPSARGRALPLADQRVQLERALMRAVVVPAGALDGWAGDLLAALEAELAGLKGRFLRALQDLLDEARREGVLLDQFQGVISLLRARVHPPPEGGDEAAMAAALEQLWHASRILIGSASVHVEGQRRLNVELAALDVTYGARGFAACLSLPVLKGLLASELPRMQFSRVAVSLYDDAHRATMRPLFLMEHGLEVEVQPVSFPSQLLAPPGFLDAAERRSVVVLPVAFGDVEKFGVAVLDAQANEMIYDVLRLHLGSAVKAASLHRQVVREVELRERLEQERVRQESRVAARIQTTLVPKRLSIEGLELSAIMKPAAEVGGDYYDVIPTPPGGRHPFCRIRHPCDPPVPWICRHIRLARRSRRGSGMQATALTFSLLGLDAHPIRVEVDSGRGPSFFQMVGLAEASVRESRVRVRAALQQLGVELDEYVITVNLAPADLKKSGGAYDLAIAIAALAALGKVPSEGLDRIGLLGELSLSGAVRPVRGVLPALRGAAEQGIPRAIVPQGNAREAASVAGVDVFIAEHLSQVVAHLRGSRPLPGAGSIATAAAEPSAASVDLAEVRGQHGARRALEIAAAGGHNLIMMGPPGSGEPGTPDPRDAPVPATTVTSRSSPASCGSPSPKSSFAGKAMEKTNSVEDTTWTINSCCRTNSWNRARWYSLRMPTLARSRSRYRRTCSSLTFLGNGATFARRSLTSASTTWSSALSSRTRSRRASSRSAFVDDSNSL
ncbi:magnesium chelatase domain-containing protein [Sorangium sp. So ce1151]|uniref:magnesium chelatase domain-containing protein n=1 Tax=Sorangium sp. So ce1151 TaxID=3133332 RepID=UPI003F5D9766